MKNIGFLVNYNIVVLRKFILILKLIKLVLFFFYVLKFGGINEVLSKNEIVSLLIVVYFVLFFVFNGLIDE